MRQVLIYSLLMIISSGSLAQNHGHSLSKLKDLKIGNGLTFHPNGEILLISNPSNEMNPKTANPFYKIYCLKWQGKEWSQPQPVDFNSDFNDYHPVFLTDGEWVIFNSDRPVPGETDQSEKINIWRVKYSNEQFGTPEYLRDINTLHHESYPSMTNKGTLYFNSDRPGGKGSMDIYKSEFKNGRYAEPILVEALNTADSENDLTVDPHERFIIFNRYHFDKKEIELYISHNVNDRWLPPKPMAGINQPGIWELTPTLSPDGKYLFYEVNGKIESITISSILNH